MAAKHGTALKKCCTSCNQLKPTTEFYSRATAGKTYVVNPCKPCAKAKWIARNLEKRQSPEGKRKYQIWMKAWRQRNPEMVAKQTERSKLRRYGMTIADWDRKLFEQGGGCAVCSCPTASPTDGRRLHVDHDHVTQKVRGLLCSRCNLLLGYMQDDPDLLLRAAAYLKQWKQQHRRSSAPLVKSVRYSSRAKKGNR